MGIAETHLTNDTELELNGYQWFGNNRKHLHVRARTGSGGVGFFIKLSLLNVFNVSVLDDSVEGILWLNMVHKVTGFRLLPCVCYLPPENSSRQVDGYEFYDNLLANIYQFQDMGLIYICGDFNSRCGDNDDFIAGVDNICARNIVDFKTNYYGSILLEFLINSNLCLLNGRNFKHNDFTSISTKGTSVVDYCIVSQDDLPLFSEFAVVRVTDLISELGPVGTIAPTAIPDHSVLLCNIQTSNVIQGSIDGNSKPDHKYDKFRLSDITNNFLASDDILTKVNDTIARLEASFHVQRDIDDAYTSWCNIVQDEMYGKLPYKTINMSCKGNKKRRTLKPWWSEKLTELWNNLCTREKIWLNCTDKAQKTLLKKQYSDARKSFDREVQRSKRFYWYKMQCDLVENAT